MIEVVFDFTVKGDGIEAVVVFDGVDLVDGAIGNDDVSLISAVCVLGVVLFVKLLVCVEAGVAFVILDVVLGIPVVLVSDVAFALLVVVLGDNVVLFPTLICGLVVLVLTSGAGVVLIVAVFRVSVVSVVEAANITVDTTGFAVVTVAGDVSSDVCTGVTVVCVGKVVVDEVDVDVVVVEVEVVGHTA